MTRRILALALLVASAACSSDSDPTDEDGNLTFGSMNARIDGSAWSAATAVGGTNTGGVMGFTGSDAAGRTITVVVAAVPAAGAQAIRVAQSTNLSMAVNEPNGTVWIATGTAGTGTLNIDSFSATEATGRFTFTAVSPSGTPAAGSRVVTDGVFNVRFVGPTP